MEHAIQFLEFIVKGIVDTPDKVTAEGHTDERGILLTLKVDQTDMGQVIGKEGKNMGAIRKIMHSYGMKNKLFVSVKLEEPEGSTFHPKVRVEYNSIKNALA